MNLNKYDIPKPVKPAITNWKESVTVIQLSEYIKQQKENSIKLYQEDGLPVLIFNPGTRDINIINTTIGIFESAAADLKELIRSGNLSIPKRVLSIEECHTDGKTSIFR